MKVVMYLSYATFAFCGGLLAGALIHDGHTRYGVLLFLIVIALDLFLPFAVSDRRSGA